MAEIGVSPRGTEKEKVGIVVAGGSGIGAACVRELAASGWRVVALSPSGRARLLAESLGGAGIDGSNTNVADLRDSRSRNRKVRAHRRGHQQQRSRCTLKATRPQR